MHRHRVAQMAGEAASAQRLRFRSVTSWVGSIGDQATRGKPAITATVISAVSRVKCQ